MPLEGPNDPLLTVVDLAGNTTLVPLHIVRDTVPPAMNMIDDPNFTPSREAVISWSATDAASGVARYRWRLETPDGTVTDWAEQEGPGLILRDEVQREGDYQIEIQARDTAGLWSESLSRDFTIDWSNIDFIPTVPSWLWENGGGLAPGVKARFLKLADEEFLDRLRQLKDSSFRPYVTTNASGVQAQFLQYDPVVVKDAEGNLLFLPVLDEEEKVQEGVLILADDTLQIIKEGKLVRQMRSNGEETLYDSKGRIVSETSFNGTVSEYRYDEDGNGNLLLIHRNTHLEGGDLIEEFDAEGYLLRRVDLEGKDWNYERGILTFALVNGVRYYYEHRENPDGTISAVLALAEDQNGVIAIFENGIITRIDLPDQTVLTDLEIAPDGRIVKARVNFPQGSDRVSETIVNGEVAGVKLPDGAELFYSAGWLREAIRPSSTLQYSYSSSAPLRITAQNSSDGALRTYDAEGKWLETLYQEKAKESYINSVPPKWQYVEPFDVWPPKDFVTAGNVSVTNRALQLKGNGANTGVNAYSNRTWDRSAGGETTLTFSFILSQNGSKPVETALLALEGKNEQGVLRRLELLQQKNGWSVRTREGGKTTSRKTINGLTLNARYWVEFGVTSNKTTIRLWKNGSARPSSPTYTWSSSDWDPKVHFWIKSGILKVEGLTVVTPAPLREELDYFNRREQPTDAYSTDLQNRAAADLPAIQIDYPASPEPIVFQTPAGPWQDSTWPLTPDRSPPTGTLKVQDDLLYTTSRTVTGSASLTFVAWST